MAGMKNGLAAIAALGSVAAGPAAAQTRASQTLPAPISADRASQPVAGANDMGGHFSPGLIIASLAILAAVLAAAGGGGGGGNDSRG